MKIRLALKINTSPQHFPCPKWEQMRNMNKLNKRSRSLFLWNGSKLISQQLSCRKVIQFVESVIDLIEIELSNLSKVVRGRASVNMSATCFFAAHIPTSSYISRT